ncbi:MAG: gamma-glutamylcyclotransferase [Chloroflexota bacterium]|nr:gamma-glutamylcyclotransferase [Chloroflexota bacterium]
MHGYRLVCDKKSQDGSGKGNLCLAPDDDVWGVVHRVDDVDEKPLTASEGGYQKEWVDVELEGDGLRRMVTYIAYPPNTDPAGRPYSWYKRYIVDGAKEHDLPTEYIRGLEQIDCMDDPDRNRAALHFATPC